MLAQLFWNSASLWPLAVGLGVLLLAGVVWIYPSQIKGLAKRWQIVLPTMRVLAIAALIFSVLRPTFVRPRTEEEHGVVLVVVDRSASMAVRESRLPPDRRVSIADALGYLPDGRRSRLYPELISDINSLQQDMEKVSRLRGDMEYARLIGRQVAEREREYRTSFAGVYAQFEMVAASPGMEKLDGELPSRLKALQQPPPSEKQLDWHKQVSETLPRIVQYFRKQQSEADTKLYNADSEVRSVCDKLTEKTRFELAERVLVSERDGLLHKLGNDVPMFGYTFAESVAPVALRAGSEPVKRVVGEPNGNRSNVAGAIASASEALNEQEIRGIVLLSDGRATGQSLSSLGVMLPAPVYSVCTGTNDSFSDLAISSVQMPASAYVGETIRVTVRLANANLPSGEYELFLNFGEKQQNRKVKVDSNNVAETTFDLQIEKAGVERVNLTLVPAESEATTENNKFSRPLKIVQDKLNVMLVGAHASWDYQYLRNALSRSKWARMSDSLLDGASLKTAPDKILQQNVIVLFGVNPTAFTPQQTDALHRAVTERGASLVMVAGGMDLESYGRNPLLGEFLPYRAGVKPVWRTWPGDRPAFRMVPAGEAVRLDALRLADDQDDNLARWSSLPALYRYLSIAQLKPNVIRTLLVEKESQVPVLVESRLGIGRVFFMGLEESWRWRLRVGERDQDRFWLQLVRYSAEEPYALVSSRLAMDLDRVVARPGEELTVRTRVAAERASASPTVEILRDGKTIRIEQASSQRGLQPGRFETKLRDLPAGNYDVAVRLPGDASSNLQMPIEIAYDRTEELANIAADAPALQQLSASTGGRSLSLEQVGELAGEIRDLRHRSGSMVDIPVWTSGYLFLFVLGCLAVEWAVRKRAGLA